MSFYVCMIFIVCTSGQVNQPWGLTWENHILPYHMWNSSLSSRKCASSFLYKSSRPNEFQKVKTIPFFSKNKSIWLKIEKIVLSVGWLLGRCIYARKLHVRLVVSYIVSVSRWRSAHISSAITSKGHCVHTGPGLFVYSPSSSMILSLDSFFANVF